MMIIDIYDDYDMTGSVTGFESYMFATTERQIEKHNSFEYFYTFVVGPDFNTSDELSTDLKCRKKHLKLFNEKSGTLDASKLPTVIVYFDDTDDIFHIAYLLTLFCEERNRVACMCAHVYQNGQIPHVHILYQKAARRIQNELPDFLRDCLEKGI